MPLAIMKEKKARDFNNYRNSIYNYNVTVRSANSIIVEAFRIGDNPELQPGAEGVVTDVTDNLFECDAHPEVFNIYLTTEEIANFSFTMRSYYDNQEHEIYMTKNGTNNIPLAIMPTVLLILNSNSTIG